MSESEERFEQEETAEAEEDVEGHKHTRLANDEPAADDESDDVEGHLRRAKHREM